MNNENQYIDNSKFDVFDAPANLWDRIENGLNEQKSKRRAIIWWRIAAGIALLGGIGVTFSLLQSTSMVPQKNQNTEVKLPTLIEDSLSTEPIDSAHVDDEFLKSNPLVLNAQTNVDSTRVSFSSTTFPSVTLTMPVMNGTYAWTSDPFGSGGSGGGSATTVTLAPSNFIASNLTTGTTITSYGFSSNATSTSLSYGGPVNAPTNGVIDGTYISPSTPTKRMIPYTTVNESNSLYGGKFGEIYVEQNNRSSYEAIAENPFKASKEDPLSTFSIDVDGASYSDVRGMINRNELPNPNAVRLEEFINYFPYSYPEPTGADPFSINTELGDCPWNKNHKLVKIGIKGKSIEKEQLPTNNLVFLLDVSGSMESSEKLQLLKKGFRLLVNELREEDRVSIVVYAGAAGLVLPPTSGANKDKIMDALNRLNAGGSTAGGQGIELAYATAEDYFDSKGNNRIILATDGDFNVGISNNDALVKLIEEKRKSGVFLTVLGFGHDNFQSDKMEKLANNGNGNFSFIDNILEAKKVLVTEMGATLQTIAKDVKIQIEFNPNYVSQYRLLGYENRMLEHQDFANDTIDAGELGAGHTVTAVYEIIPPGVEAENEPTYEPELKYSKVEYSASTEHSSEMATVKFRYKEPTGTTSKLIERTIEDNGQTNTSTDFEFIQSVIEFGLILRHSSYAGTSNFDSILARARSAKGDDPFGYRGEFISVVEKAQLLAADPLVE